MKVHHQETGTQFPYTWYHNDIFIDGEKVGEAHYDKKQGLLIGFVTYKGKRSKFFYRQNPEQICTAVRKWAEQI